MTRQLLVTVRVLPAGDAAAYDAAWAELRAAVESAGGHAWRFASPDRADRRLEFIEWKLEPGRSGLLETDAIAGRLRSVDALGRAETRQQWEESP